MNKSFKALFFLKKGHKFKAGALSLNFLHNLNAQILCFLFHIRREFALACWKRKKQDLFTTSANSVGNGSTFKDTEEDGVAEALGA